MKFLFSLIITCFAGLSMLSAQNDLSNPRLHEGSVTMKNGDTNEGILEFSMNHPWDIQRGIRMFDKSLLGEKKIKGKDKTNCKPKDCTSFETGGMKYEAHKTMIGGGTYGGDMKALPKWYFLQLLEEGPINLYIAYGNPPAVASGVDFETIYDDLRSNPEMLLKKGDGKIKYLNTIDVAKWIEDSSDTAQKFADGGYGNKVRKEGKKFGNFLKAQMENQNVDMMRQVIQDYNAEMGGDQ